jgi:dienelactone hydrolase
MPNELIGMVHDPEICIPTGRNSINADLTVPRDARGIVVFAHGSGSSRHSPRNLASAATLQHHGFATLLADLLTTSEGERDEWTREYRFDIGMLAQRVVDVMDWVSQELQTKTLPLGLFGASTGAAAALVAAAQRPENVRAVVSRGGRPDLAHSHLASVRAPTLLIVGSRDTHVLALNRTALRQLGPASALEIVQGATHLFPEPWALERVNALAAAWFERYLVKEQA